MQTINSTYIDKSLNHAMRLYLKEISKIPLLTVEEEKALGYRAQAGDKEALQKMIESNLQFVIKLLALLDREAECSETADDFCCKSVSPSVALHESSSNASIQQRSK